MQKTKTIGTVIAIIIMIDMFGFMIWALSGQTPINGFYIGSITSSTINLIK